MNTQIIYVMPLRPGSTANMLVCVIYLRPSSVWHTITSLSRFTFNKTIFLKHGLVFNDLSDSWKSYSNDTVVF
jgi:hypothetical protein